MLAGTAKEKDHKKNTSFLVPWSSSTFREGVNLSQVAYNQGIGIPALSGRILEFCVNLLLKVMAISWAKNLPGFPIDTGWFGIPVTIILNPQ